MQKMVFVVFALLSFITHATEVTLATVITDGKKNYVLHAGAFPQENNALQFKLKLAALLKHTVQIAYVPEKKLYFVDVGPIADRKQALALQTKLTTGLSLETLPAAQAIDINSSAVERLNTINTHAEKKLWNLKNADIRAVIGEVSRVTGKNFIIDPRVQGKISIVSSTPISNEELYQVFLSMLQVSGYATLSVQGITKIVPNIDAKMGMPTPIVHQSAVLSGDEMLVKVIAVHYVPAEQLVPVLRPLMPQWSNVSAYGPSNMLILSGRASNIKSLSTIIKQIDSPISSGIDIIPLKHSLAMDIVNTLKDLTKIQPNANGGSHNQAQFAADDRNNAILLSATPTERLRLRLIIQQLDREVLNGRNSNTQVVYLNYLRAEDIVPILAGIAQANFSGNVGTTIGTVTRPILDSTNPVSSLSNNATGSGSGGTIAPPPPPSALPNTSGASTQNEGATKPTVQIIAEPNTNSVIINAPATLIQVLKSVINQLDIRPAQLLIEALVAEVNATDVNNLGIEWGSNRQTNEPSNFRPGFAILNGKTKIADFQAQIYALARERRANILSTPSVVVLDNRQAKISVGKQVSVASTTYPNNAGGTTTASPYVTYDRVNVALHLYVRPQITRGNGIQMQIDQGNDTLDPSDTANANNPTFNISSIVTAIHVESGDIVVLGGLTQDSLGNDDNHLPILGDIPGIGRLFQHNVRAREKRVLMVFIRPIILKNKQDNDVRTNNSYHDIRNFQLQLLRSQETYNENNKDTVLPARVQKVLPKPFSHITPAGVIMK